MNLYNYIIYNSRLVTYHSNTVTCVRVVHWYKCFNQIWAMPYIEYTQLMNTDVLIYLHIFTLAHVVWQKKSLACCVGQAA